MIQKQTLKSKVWNYFLLFLYVMVVGSLATFGGLFLIYSASNNISANDLLVMMAAIFFIKVVAFSVVFLTLFGIDWLVMKAEKESEIE